MSFDIFFQRFTDDPSISRADAVRAILEPLIGQRSTDWIRIFTDDGSAEVYGYDESLDSLMVNRVSGSQVWSVLHAVAEGGGFAVMPVGCGTFVTAGQAQHDLPEGLPEPILVVRSGAELQAAIEAA